jgi:hypothetical protein
MAGSHHGNEGVRPLRFAGSASYVATGELALAVNAAITLARPLLVKGEPGTGKTQLAQEVARALGAPLLSGTSSRPASRSTGSTNTTRSRGCATRSSATSA